MKRILYFSLTICAVAMLGGWVAARVHASFRERESAEKAKLAVEAETKKPAVYFSQVAREADEAVILYRDAQGEHEVRLNDPEWISQLPLLLGSGSYVRRDHGLWVSTPRIRLYRTKVQTLDMMALGAILRVYGKEYGGDYLVGEELTTAILALAKKAEPNQSSQRNAMARPFSVFESRSSRG